MHRKFHGYFVLAINPRLRVNTIFLMEAIGRKVYMRAGNRMATISARACQRQNGKQSSRVEEFCSVYLKVLKGDTGEFIGEIYANSFKV